MTNANSRNQRLGALALILSAILTAAGLLLRGPLLGPETDAQTFAAAAASSRNQIAEMILPLSLVAQLFAFMGLYGYLRNDKTERGAFWGMVFSILGNGLFLPFAGMYAFVVPVIGKLYLEGNLGVIEVARAALSPGPGFVYLIASAFALTIGAGLLFMAMWRNNLPRWLPFAYLLQAVLLSFGAAAGYAFEIVGAVLLLISSLYLAGRMK